MAQANLQAIASSDTTTGEAKILALKIWQELTELRQALRKRVDLEVKKEKSPDGP